MNITRNEDAETVKRTNAMRKARFRAALALAGMTQESWADREGVTPAHLSYVLSGTRESRSLTEKIDAFTRKHLKGQQVA